MTQPIDFSQPQRLPLVPALDSRSFDLSKDAILKNCIAEKQEAIGGYKINKRFGTGPILYVAAVGTTKGCGLYYNSGFASYIYVVTANNTNSYVISRGGSVLFTTPIVSSAPNLWDFEDMATHFILGARFEKAYAMPYSTGVPAEIVDPDFTSISRVRGFAYLNGRLYIMDTIGNIYGSEIDNPLSWIATNVIRARSQPDLAVAIVKHLSYVVAFKQWSLEFFSDVGAAPPGSVLALVPGLYKNYGCLASDTIRGLDGELFWVSNNRSRAPQVVRMVNAQTQIVSTTAVEKVLSTLNTSTDAIMALTGVCFKSSGHSFYMINLPAVLGLPAGSLVYDISEDLWYFWTKYNQFTRLQESMNYAFETFGNAGKYFQNSVTGDVIPYASDDTYVKDTVGNIESDIITSNIEFGTKRWKVLSRLSFGIDEQVGSELLVRYNDHDYDPAQWSQYRSVDLNQAEPFLQNEGRFKRRAYHFRHTQATKMRIAYVDMQLSLGSI